MLNKMSLSITFMAEHLTSILIAILTLFVGFNGVLFDIRKNVAAKPSVKNTSNFGRLFIATIFILGGVTLAQQIDDKKVAEGEKKQLDKDLKSVEKNWN